MSKRGSNFTTDKELNKRVDRLVQFCGKEIADIVGDMLEEKQEKLKETPHNTPPREMVTNIMGMTMQFTHLLNRETLRILGQAIMLDPNCGMESGSIIDRKDNEWRDYFRDSLK